MVVLLAPAQTPTQQASGWVASRGVRLQVPAGWTCNQDLLNRSGPIDLTNFGGAYLRGGILPPGGAEITITSVPAPPNLEEFIRRELKGASIRQLAPAQTAPGAFQAAYTEDLARDAVMGNVAIYGPHGATLYKFYLSYWTGDPGEARLTETLARIAREARLR